MIQLIKNITGNFVTEIKGNVQYVKTISGEIQNGDYIQIGGLTAFLQNLSQTPETASYTIPNFFGYQPIVKPTMETLDFSSCNRKAVWYNMQESPEYMMESVQCGAVSDLTFSITSFIVNGIEYVDIPYSSETLTKLNIIWVPADNSIQEACGGSTSGWTYTNFVDFLNYFFDSLGLDYTAILSYKEINLDEPSSKSKTGFYLSFPKNDIFSLKMEDSGQSFISFNLTYKNDGLYYPSFPYNYYFKDKDIDYNCEKNIVIE